MKGTIAAGDKLTAEAGGEILKAGGNAFDAAIAAAFAAPLTEPALTSLGGGGFLLGIEKNSKPIVYDFFVDVPPKRIENPDFYPVYVDFGSAVQEFHIGCGSIAIPGMVAGLLRVHQEKGKLPLEEVIKPAVRYAKEGIFLSKTQASFIKLLEPIFTATEEARKIYAPNGKLINEKTLFKNPDYADFLENLAKEGSWIFYEGEIADKIENLSLQRNGLIRKEDLRKYKVEEKNSISFSFKKYKIHTNPPPSLGGILISFSLRLLENENLKEFGSLSHISALIESMYTTQLFRKEKINDNVFSDLSFFLEDKEILEKYKQIFKKRLNLWGNTTHISVLDEEGNAVSMTTTNGEGSGCVIPKTGIMLNNMLGEEDLNPQGFFKYPPYVRLPSMMSPTIVLQNETPFLILGSAGSNRIRSAIIQTVLNVLVFRKHVKEAVELPRIHYENGIVYFEPGFNQEVIEKTKQFYKTILFKEKSLFFGGVQAVFKDFSGAGDPRRGGYSLAILK
ncbi:MAG: gamma-glutamyltransferase [Aquificae bacterium]|nr:gamma-glutamyltransferase [Aquificota bacterium]